MRKVFIHIFLTMILFINVAFGKDGQIIYVYNEEGAGEECVSHTVSMLRQNIGKKYAVRLIDSKTIAKRQWVKKAALLVIPGGADIPYTKKLNGIGNEIIKQYVKNGGRYLGICAGAYYGAGFVEFDKGGELEVLGKRELAFFPGKAIGPILAKYDYKTNIGARAASIKVPAAKKEVIAYYNGGSYFQNADSYPNVEVIGYYNNSSPSLLPAIIKISYGKGKVILSGVHFEYSPQLPDKNDKYLVKILPTLNRGLQGRNELIKLVLNNLELTK